MTIAIGQSMAQSPDAFNYQAVARDAAGDVLADQAIGIKVSLHNGSAGGVVDYSETFAPTTNEFGLFTLAIGTGTVVSGDFSTISWGTAQYWLQVEMDPTGGVTYADMGTSQLLSVPYAMYAENTNALPAGSSGQTLRNNGTGWVASDFLVNTGSSVGIGTTTPSFNFELQSSQPYFYINSTGTYGGLLLNRPDTNSYMRLIYRSAGSNLWYAGLLNTKSDYTISRASVADGTFHISLANGNIGVNCVAPLYKFEVDGPTGTFNGSGIRIQNTSAASGWSFYPSASGAMIIGKTSNLGSFDGTTGAYTALSDARLKTNIRTLESVLPSLMGLELKRYEFIYNNPSRKESIGIIAQDLQKLFPELVSVNTANDGNPLVDNQLGVDYSGLSVIAIKAIQEQQLQIGLLNQQIELLKQEIELLKK